MTSLKPWADVKVGDIIPVLALPPVVVEQLIQACWRIDTLPDVGTLCRATVPLGATG